MARGSSYTYNPETGKWNKNTSAKDTSTTKKSSTKSKGDNLETSNSGKKSSDGKNKKKYNYIEVNTLSGTLSFIVNEKTIKLKAGDTVKLKGLGKYLSGNYYVKDITRQIGSSGYSHNATLIKTDMGSSLKSSTKSSNKSKSTKKVVTKKEKSMESKKMPRELTLLKKEIVCGL